MKRRRSHRQLANMDRRGSMIAASCLAASVMVASCTGDNEPGSAGSSKTSAGPIGNSTTGSSESGQVSGRTSQTGDVGTATCPTSADLAARLGVPVRNPRNPDQPQRGDRLNCQYIAGSQPEYALKLSVVPGDGGANYREQCVPKALDGDGSRLLWLHDDVREDGCARGNIRIDIDSGRTDGFGIAVATASGREECFGIVVSIAQKGDPVPTAERLRPIINLIDAEIRSYCKPKGK